MKQLKAFSLRLRGRVVEIDLEDALLACGFLLLSHGISRYSAAAGYIVEGVQCYVFAYLIERDRQRTAAGKK